MTFTGASIHFDILHYVIVQGVATPSGCLSILIKIIDSDRINLRNNHGYYVTLYYTRIHNTGPFGRQTTVMFCWKIPVPSCILLLLLLRSSCSCLSDSETRCHNVVHCQGKFFCCAIEFLLQRSVVWPRSGS